MLNLLMTVASFLLVGLSFLGEGRVFTFALYMGGMFMGHVITEALNEE